MIFCGTCSARTRQSKFVCCDCIMFLCHARQRVIQDSTVIIDRFSKEILDIRQLREPNTYNLGLNRKKSRVKALRDLISCEHRDIASLSELVERLEESNRERKKKIVQHRELRKMCKRHHGMLIRSHEKQLSLLETQRAGVKKWSHDLTEAFLKLLPLVKPNGKGYHSISRFHIPDRLLPLKPMNELVKKYISAGLGIVILLTQVLAKYHHFTMPHRTKFQSSSSTIFDANDKTYPIYLPSGNPTDDERHHMFRGFQLLDQNILALCEHASSNAMSRRLFQRGSNQFVSNLLLLVNVNREEQRHMECTTPSLYNPLENGFLPNLPLVRRTRSSGSRPSFEHPTKKKP